MNDFGFRSLVRAVQAFFLLMIAGWLAFGYVACL